MGKSRRAWADEEDRIILENYPKGPIAEWRYMLPHRHPAVIRRRIAKLGLGIGNLLEVRAVARFWKHVEVVGKDGCWQWHGCKTNDGYGIFGAMGKPVTAHKFSYELHFGKITNGLQVLHKCDNPECANPAHLWLGTQKENVQDAIRKGRRLKRHNRK